MNKLLLYIDSMQLGGANRVMSVLAKHFSEKQVNVLLVNDIMPEKDIPEYQIPENVKRVFLDSVRETGLKKNINRIKKLRKIIKEEKPDVVLSFMGPPNIRMLISALGLKVKKIASVRNDPNIEYGTGIRKYISCIVMRFADGIVFQTKDAMQYFPESVKRKGKIILNPVSKLFFESEWQEGGLEIAVIGRLESQKNPMNALYAFEKIANDIPEYSLGFYGDGSLNAELRRAVKDKALVDKVRFHGRISNPEKVLEKAAAYVLCSDYEGLPNALMEAMAVGVPCISTACPCGGPEMLIENESQGVLVPCADSNKLAEELLLLLKDSERKKNMSKAAHKRAESFLPENVLREWEDYFELIQNQ